MASNSVVMPNQNTAELMADKFRSGSVASLVIQHAGDSIEANLKAHGMDVPRFQANLALALQDAWEKMDTNKRAVFAPRANREAAKFAMACAAMGLMPGGSGIDRKVACIARFKKAKVNNIWQEVDVSLCAQAEWRGMYELLMRANSNISGVQIEIVRPDDVVEIDRINNRVVRHISGAGMFSGESGIELTKDDWILHGCAGMYAIVRFKDGSQRIKVITLQDTIRYINASETMRVPKGDYDGRASSPWVTATDPMLKKSGLHALGRDVTVWGGGGGVDQRALEALGYADRAENEALGNDPRRGAGTVASDAIYDLAESITGSKDAADAAARKLGYENAKTATDAGLGGRLIDELQPEMADTSAADAG